MQIFNDLETIYKDGVIEKDDMHVCTVCEKQFKTRSGAMRHHDKQACHSYRNIFKGTETESLLFSIFKELMAIEKKHVPGMSRFRKTRSYTIIAKFYVFCYQNGIRDHFDYLEYALSCTKWKVVMQGVHLACMETVLQDYRKNRRLTPNMDNDKRFFNIHEDQFMSDPNFTLRALERGDITVSYLFSQIDLDEFLDECTEAEEYRFEKFLEMVS